MAACTPNVSDGVCTFSNVEPGKYIVESGAWQEADGTTKTFYKAGTTGTADGFAASALTIRDDSYTEIRIQRQRGVTITGKISEQSEPARTLVETVTRTPLAEQPTVLTSASTDATGVYRIPGLPSTEHRVVANPVHEAHRPTWFGGPCSNPEPSPSRQASGNRQPLTSTSCARRRSPCRPCPARLSR